MMIVQLYHCQLDVLPGSIEHNRRRPFEPETMFSCPTPEFDGSVSR